MLIGRTFFAQGRPRAIFIAGAPAVELVTAGGEQLDLFPTKSIKTCSSLSLLKIGIHAKLIHRWQALALTMKGERRAHGEREKRIT